MSIAREMPFPLAYNTTVDVHWTPTRCAKSEVDAHWTPTLCARPKVGAQMDAHPVCKILKVVAQMGAHLKPPNSAPTPPTQRTKTDT